jgi:hypothetical protein
MKHYVVKKQYRSAGGINGVFSSLDDAKFQILSYVHRWQFAGIEVWEGENKTDFIGLSEILRAEYEELIKSAPHAEIKLSLDDDDETLVGQVILEGKNIPLHIEESEHMMFDKYDIQVAYGFYNDMVVAYVYSNVYKKVMRNPNKLRKLSFLCVVEDSDELSPDYNLQFGE